MVQNVNSLISSVKSSVGTVYNSSVNLDKIVEENTTSINQVAISVEEIAKSSTVQAEETQNGAYRVKNLAERIEMVTGLSVKTDLTAATTIALRGKGLNAIEQVSYKSEDNRKAAEKASDIIAEVDKTSIEIGSITEAISQISEQTNLLSLNAAIEAARAGEQGKGFAVVAEEIRKLANQSAISASKVRELINGIQSKSRLAVKAMEEGRTLANEQNSAVIEAKSIFSELLTAIDNMSADVQEIKNHSLQMENDKNEIVGILETLSASTEQNSAATQEVSAATTQQLTSIEQIASHTEELKNLAIKLREASDAFKVE
jgi:methyl-accepting chemotaxis protein